jgi:hypothetical protein
MGKIKKIILIILIIILVYAIVQVVNAAKYKMIVNVKEGENIMGINPLTESLDFGDLSRNNGMTRYVKLNNNGGGSVFFAVFKFGEISDLVKIDKNFFVLKPGEEVKLAYEIQIPPSAQIKKYSGWTIIFRLPKLW